MTPFIYHPPEGKLVVTETAIEWLVVRLLWQEEALKTKRWRKIWKMKLFPILLILVVTQFFHLFS